MKTIDQMDDLRMSIGLGSSESIKRNKKAANLDESTILLRELDKVRRECTDLKKTKEQMQRERLNQTFGKSCFCLILFRVQLGHKGGELAVAGVRAAKDGVY